MANNGDPFSGYGKRDALCWDDARVFLAIARRGTLSAAAADLGLGVATVTRRIERLEAALRACLFSRRQNGYQLTDEGEELVGRAEALEQAGYAFGAGLDAHAPVAGRVRLATAEYLASGLIIPALPALLAQHPALGVEIVTDVQTVNLHRRDADLALRMVKPERGNVAVRRLGALGYGLYGAPAYVEARSGGAATDFSADRFVGWGEAWGHLAAAQWTDRILRGRALALAATSLQAQVAAVQAGLGLAVLPHFVARPAGLVCLQHDLGVDQGVWLAVHAALAHSRRVRVIADFLGDLVHASSARLRGD